MSSVRLFSGVHEAFPTCHRLRYFGFGSSVHNILRRVIDKLPAHGDRQVTVRRLECCYGVRFISRLGESSAVRLYVQLHYGITNRGVGWDYGLDSV